MEPPATLLGQIRFHALEWRIVDGGELPQLVPVSGETVLAWLDRSASALQGEASRVMGTKGSHLVLDHPVLHRLLDGRMAYFEATDGRVCIVYPFLGRVLVGSTDIPVDDPDQASTDPAEVHYLMGVLREVFPRLSFDARHVLYTYVGVRPLARSDADKPGQISRDHSVVIDAPSPSRDIPVVGLVGGKWTTFRALAEEGTKQGDWALIEVTDSGVGMDAAALEHAFEPFFSTKTGGSGLGLANARRNIEREGGTVTLASAPGQGATVTVTLPEAPAPRPTGDSASAPSR